RARARAWHLGQWRVRAAVLGGGPAPPARPSSARAPRPARRRRGRTTHAPRCVGGSKPPRRVWEPPPAPPHHLPPLPRRPFQDGGGHAWPSGWTEGPTVGLGSTSRSSKLGVCWRRCVLTCR